MENYTIQEYAQIVSLFLTVPNVVLSLCVCIFWLPACQQISSKGESLCHTDWFILGVFVSFLGASLDNIYWAIPWTAYFLDLGIREKLVSIGVYFNIFSRQGLGIVAATCHVISYFKSNNTKMRAFNTLFILANLLGVLFASLLITAKKL